MKSVKDLHLNCKKFTMPQKINPKLAKDIIANAQKRYAIIPVGYYSSVRLFEGDNSQYLLFDGLLEEAIELCVEVIIRAEELTRTIQVYPEKMKANANLLKGLDNSEYVMMAVADKIGKDAAHSDISLVSLSKLTSLNSAKFINVDHVKGSIELNKDADLIVLNDQLDVLHTFCKGIKKES